MSQRSSVNGARGMFMAVCLCVSGETSLGG